MAQPGDVLADRWRLVEKIDAGAMGEIFRGVHQLLGHTVAIKVMMPDIARDNATIERFLREAKIAARLQHKHVVRVEDFGLAADGRPFLVMELLRGESLARRLERTPRLPPRDVLEIVRQIATALDTAHGAGIIHRDLKPENLFLLDEENGGVMVKVLDFGVAKFTDVLAAGGEATASNTLIGTPKYMSPEQARSSRELDGRSDLWALGMLTYEMLVGRHAFEGEAIAELLVAILTHPIPAPTSLCPELPPALDSWALRAMARNRAERFASGREFHDALGDALAGRVDQRWAPVVTAVAQGRGADEPGQRRATLRVKRPRPGDVAVPPVDDTGSLGVAVTGVGVEAGTEADAPGRSGLRVRPSWLAVAAVATLAGVGLVAAPRHGTQRHAAVPSRQSAAPAPTPARQLAPAKQLALVAAPAPQALVVPEALVAAPALPAPGVAPGAAPGAAPAPLVDEVHPGPPSRRDHRHGPGRHDHQAPSGSGGYDPDHI